MPPPETLEYFKRVLGHLDGTDLIQEQVFTHQDAASSYSIKANFKPSEVSYYIGFVKAKFRPSEVLRLLPVKVLDQAKIGSFWRSQKPVIFLYIVVY